MNLPRKVLPLSHSALEAFSICPRQMYETRILQNYAGTDSPQMLYGKLVHTILEDAVGKAKAIPREHAYLEPFADYIRATPGQQHCEFELAVDRAYVPTDFKDPTAVFRGIADFVAIDGNTCYMYDYKTGKIKPSQQMERLAALVFANKPNVTVIKTAFIWLAHDDATIQTFHVADESVLKQKLAQDLGAVLAAEAAEKWPAKPSGLCKKYCPVITCEYFGIGSRRW